MPEYLSGRKELMTTLIEDLLFYSGILKLKKDGLLSKDGKQSLAANLLPARYTREYQIYLGGKRINASVKFIYDNRENLADVQMGFGDYMILKKELLFRGVNNERVQVPETRKDISFRTSNGETENFTKRTEQSGILNDLRKLKW